MLRKKRMMWMGMAQSISHSLIYLSGRPTMPRFDLINLIISETEAKKIWIPYKKTSLFLPLFLIAYRPILAIMRNWCFTISPPPLGLLSPISVMVVFQMELPDSARNYWVKKTAYGHFRNMPKPIMQFTPQVAGVYSVAPLCAFMMKALSLSAASASTRISPKH